MKCEKCGKEATFYYSSSINGEKTERHLCADCARAEGFGGALDYSSADMFGSMLGGFFGDFFAPQRSLMSAFDSFGVPMRSIMAPVAPRVNVVIGTPQPGRVEPLEDSETRIPTDAGAEVRSRREIAALKHQLREAVKAEDFEKAIELRDKLKALEN